MKRVISELKSAPKLREQVLVSIENDLKQLSLNDPTFLDGAEGAVDYYSIHAKTQMENKEKLLEKYLYQLMLIQDAFIYIQPKKEKIRTLESNDNPIKRKINNLIQNVNANHQELKKVANKEDLTDEEKNAYNESKEELENKISRIDDELTGLLVDESMVTQYNAIKMEMNTIQISLDKHRRLKEKIPDGMLDVKRALSIEQELRFTQQTIEMKIKRLNDLTEESKKNDLRNEIAALQEKEKALPYIAYSDLKEVDVKIKDMLNDLIWLMTSSIKGYQKVAVSGGDLDAYLHQTTGFYWETLYLYRKTVCAIDDYIQNHKHDLTAEGKLVAECLRCAVSKIPDETAIKDALEQVKRVDENPDNRADEYDTCVASQDVRFYKKEAIELVDTLFEEKNDAPFFFIPYHSGNYVLDHPARTDLAGALGNCYGETQMFLQRINQDKPAFNNICPQTDLVNFQLNQSRQSGQLSIHLGTFNAQSYGLINLSTNPEQMSKEELSVLLNGKPTYALFGSKIYYIDSDLNVLVFNETIRTRLKEAFPQCLDQQSDAPLDALKKIKNLTGHVQEKSMVTWDNVKDILTGSVDSTKHGDICSIKLSGARVDHHDKEVSHVIAFIKMKNPTPYKYIVYDYGLGTMGFVNDEQLQDYFKKTLEHYILFSQLVVKKIDEVSDACQAFVNGPGQAGIQPLKKGGILTTFDRKYWTKTRLLFLIKYSNGSMEDIKFIFEKVALLTNDKDVVYNAIFEKKEFDFNQLFQMSISFAVKGNADSLNKILEKPNCIEDKCQGFLNELRRKPEGLKKIVTLVSDGKIPAKSACKVFCTHEAIVLAAFKKDPTSIQFADVGVAIDLICSGDVPRSDCIQLDDKARILKMINDEKLIPRDIIQLFYSDNDIIQAVLNSYQTVNKEALAKQACDLLIADIKNLMSNDIKPPKFDNKTKLSRLKTEIPILVNRLETLKQEKLERQRAQEAKKKSEQDAMQLQETEKERLALIDAIKTFSSDDSPQDAAPPPIPLNVTTDSEDGSYHVVTHAGEEVKQNTITETATEAERPIVVPPAETRLSLVRYLQERAPMFLPTTLLALINQDTGDEQTSTDLTVFMQSLKTIFDGGITELLFMNQVNGHCALISLDIQQLLKTPIETVRLLLFEMNQQGWDHRSTVILPCAPTQANALRAQAGQAVHHFDALSTAVTQLTGTVVSRDAPLIVEPVPVNHSPVQNPDIILRVWADATQTSPIESESALNRSEKNEENAVTDEVKKNILDQFDKDLGVFKRKLDQLGKGPKLLHDKEKYKKVVEATTELYRCLIEKRHEFNHDGLLEKFLKACNHALDHEDRNKIFDENREALWLRFFTYPIEQLKACINKRYNIPVFETQTDTSKKVQALKESVKKILPQSSELGTSPKDGMQGS